MLRPWEDNEEEVKKPSIDLSLRLQINEATGMSSDYFSDFRHLESLIRDLDQTIPEAVKSRLESTPNWRIRTYTEYVRDFLSPPLAHDLHGRVDECSQLFHNEKAIATVPLLEACVVVLNEEIDKVRLGNPLDEQRFRENWNQIKLYIYWTQGFAI